MSEECCPSCREAVRDHAAHWKHRWEDSVARNRKLHATLASVIAICDETEAHRSTTPRVTTLVKRIRAATRTAP